MTRVFRQGRLCSGFSARRPPRPWHQRACFGAKLDRAKYRVRDVNDVATMSLTLTNAACMSGVEFLGRVSNITLPYYEDQTGTVNHANAIWRGCAAPLAANARLLLGALNRTFFLVSTRFRLSQG